MQFGRICERLQQVVPGGANARLNPLLIWIISENTMPHIIVKSWPGKTEEQKRELTRRITQDVMDVLAYNEDAVSVAFVEVAPDQWAEEVYGPDIKAQWDALYKKPGYSM